MNRCEPGSCFLGPVPPPPLEGVNRINRAGSTGPLNLWPEHSPYQPEECERFRLDVFGALDELMGAPFFITKYQLQQRGEFGLDLYQPDRDEYLLEITGNAVTRQAQILESAAHADDYELESLRLKRLQAEQEGLHRVIELLNHWPDSWVVWISPPGMGLESDESRINLFYLRGATGRVIAYSLVAVDNLEAMQLYLRSVGVDLPDDAPVSTSGFLVSPAVVGLTLEDLIKRLKFVNLLYHYSPSGQARLKDLLTTYPKLEAGLDERINGFFASFYLRRQPPDHQTETSFLYQLYTDIIVPYLRDYLQDRGYQVDDSYLMYLAQQAGGCGGFDVFSVPVGPPLPSVFIGKVFNTLFGLPCDKCRKEKEEEE